MTESLDWFSIVVLLIAVILIVFLIINAVYNYYLLDGRPPSRAEAEAMLWTSAILSVIAVIVAILAIYKLVVHHTGPKKKEDTSMITPKKTEVSVSN